MKGEVSEIKGEVSEMRGERLIKKMIDRQSDKTQNIHSPSHTPLDSHKR